MIDYQQFAEYYNEEIQNYCDQWVYHSDRDPFSIELVCDDCGEIVCNVISESRWCGQRITVNCLLKQLLHAIQSVVGDDKFNFAECGPLIVRNRDDSIEILDSEFHHLIGSCTCDDLLQWAAFVNQQLNTMYQFFEDEWTGDDCESDNCRSDECCECDDCRSCYETCDDQQCMIGEVNRPVIVTSSFRSPFNNRVFVAGTMFDDVTMCGEQIGLVDIGFPFPGKIVQSIIETGGMIGNDRQYTGAIAYAS